MTLDARILTAPEGLSEIEADWRLLAEARENAFVSPEWFRCWWSRFGDEHVPLVVAVRAADGRLAGVLPLVEARGGRPRMARFAGAALGDYFHPAAVRGEEVAVARAAAAALRDAGGSWSTLRLDHVGAEAEWWRELAEAGSPPLATVTQGSSTLPFASIRGLSWDQYLGGKSSNFRQQVRRRERRLVSDHGGRLRDHATESELERGLEVFFDLHERRWRGGSTLASPRAKQFLTDFAVSAMRRGWMRLPVLEADGAPVAALYGWRIGGRYAGYQTGLDPNWQQHSVGFVLWAMCLRAAIEEGAAVFDMMLGDQPYKSRFGDQEEPVRTLTLVRSRHGDRVLISAEARLRALARRTPGFGGSRAARVKRAIGSRLRSERGHG
jgi:CelD/BcsL family acetyltransferase involved in cellulose biosynthesis